MVKGYGEFLDALASLEELARKNGEKPIIHIETHGLDDQSGIIFSDGTYTFWDELGAHLAPLNEATGFNLLVCVAACFGGHSLSMVRPLDPSPCLALIGPTEITYGPELLAGFRTFYRSLLSDLNANEALKKLRGEPLANGRYLAVTAPEWFFNCVHGYLENHCTRARIQERAIKISHQLENEGRSVPLEYIEHIGAERTKLVLDELFRKFFVTDRISDNKGRFADELTSARQRADTFLVAQGLKPV